MKIKFVKTLCKVEMPHYSRELTKLTDSAVLQSRINESSMMLPEPTILTSGYRVLFVTNWKNYFQLMSTKFRVINELETRYRE